jgi:hypothetical protein
MSLGKFQQLTAGTVVSFKLGSDFHLKKTSELYFLMSFFFYKLLARYAALEERFENLVIKLESLIVRFSSMILLTVIQNLTYRKRFLC